MHETVAPDRNVAAVAMRPDISVRGTGTRLRQRDRRSGEAGHDLDLVSFHGLVQGDVVVAPEAVQGDAASGVGHPFQEKHALGGEFRIDVGIRNAFAARDASRNGGMLHHRDPYRIRCRRYHGGRRRRADRDVCGSEERRRGCKFGYPE